jgi:uncharacterized protein
MVFVLLSPSKTLDFDTRRTGLKSTVPHFQARAIELAGVLKKLSAMQLGKLMSISPKLSELNAARYKKFSEQVAAPAVLAYQGDTYVGLNAADLSDEELKWAQNHIGILTGLYGMLQPLDAMQAYRLEMGTKLVVGSHKDLYAYWGSDITDRINALVKKNKLNAVIGCASNEYLSSVQIEDLDVPFINCDFKENKSGKLATVGLFAKRARGMMARYVIEHQVADAEALKKFNSAGYKFDKKLSTETNYVFVR